MLNSGRGHAPLNNTIEEAKVVSIQDFFQGGDKNRRCPIFGFF